MKTVKLENGITYNVIAENKITGKASEQGFYTHMLILVRPKGNKEFWATKDINGLITLN